ncbi:MAG TPA: ATPase, partial [Polyangiales bacterium]
PVWVTALLASGSLAQRPLELDVYELLRRYASDNELGKQLRGLRERGQTDQLSELTARLRTLLAGPECGVLIEKRGLSLSALEALFADLPGDQRSQLQDALGGNPTALGLLDVQPGEVITNYAGSAAQRKVNEWKAQPLKAHRVALLVTAVRAHVLSPAVATELRKGSAQRISLGHFLAQVGERWGLPLAEALHKLGVTPVRPS